ncbi:hypothetical protein ABGB17_09715 [Sphaerisporangium sp. B11E5]|uniref:hypothetical protein n=1 Tax=Sphaerisporangium sp. B11E5 TaxID=3153563 RepID=UPI00325D6F24
MLAATPMPGSVVLVVWLRRGLSPELVADYLPEIATACFARRAVLGPHRFGSPVVTLEVKRG